MDGYDVDGEERVARGAAGDSAREGILEGGGTVGGCVSGVEVGGWDSARSGVL